MSKSFPGSYGTGRMFQKKTCTLREAFDQNKKVRDGFPKEVVLEARGEG